jgi:L-aminopeptidase/D-esterase-like protein
MTLTRLVVVLVGLLLGSGALTGNASATPVTACQNLYWPLREGTYNAKSSFTNQQDLTDNLKILDSVSMRLTDVKHPFVDEDLTRYQTNLGALATQGKLDPAVAQRLSAQAQDVIDCANTLDMPPR